MNTKLSTLLWTLANWIIAIIATYLLDINYIYAPLIVPVLNLVTKEINRAFNTNYTKK
jgi:hypothetical protein